MPEFSPDDSLSDAIAIFRYLIQEKKGPFVVVGSSSGGQMAAQVSLDWVKQEEKDSQKEGQRTVIGVLLRSPVTCNPSTPSSLPLKFREAHTSLSPTFYTSLIGNTCVDDEHRTKTKLPLEEDEEVVKRLPRHWIQVATNDVFYSDGVCYGELLRGLGVQVRLDVVVGWPHTFWLKAPECKFALLLL